MAICPANGREEFSRFPLLPPWLSRFAAEGKRLQTEAPQQGLSYDGYSPSQMCLRMDRGGLALFPSHILPIEQPLTPGTEIRTTPRGMNCTGNILTQERDVWDKNPSFGD